MLTIEHGRGLRGSGPTILVTLSIVVGALVPLTGPTVPLLLVFVVLSAAIRNHPQVATAFWLTATFITPIWVGPTFFVFFPPSTIYAFVIAPAALKAIRPKPVTTDLWIGLLILCATVAVILAGSPRSALSELIVNWLPAYFVARMLSVSTGLAWTLRCFAVLAGFIAAWSIAEYALDLHILTHFYTQTSQGFWAEIQYRNGVARSEASLGHAIALGGSLVLAIPIALTLFDSALTRTLLSTLLSAGVLSTQSRGPIIAAVFAIFGTVILYQELKPSTRLVYGVMIAGSTALVAPAIWNLFTSGEDEIADSTNYREALLSSFSGDIHLLGPASGVTRDASGAVYYRSFESIDSTHVLFSIEYGWLFLVIVALGAFAIAFSAVQGRSITAFCLTPQLIILYTVAPITQYAILVFFVIGCHAQSIARDNQNETSSAHPQLLELSRP